MSKYSSAVFSHIYSISDPFNSMIMIDLKMRKIKREKTKTNETCEVIKSASYI